MIPHLFKKLFSEFPAERIGFLRVLAGMKTISFLLFFLLANTAFSQENRSNPANASACGDSVTRLLHMLVTEADALYEQKKYQPALEKYERYVQLHKANAHVNGRIRELQDILIGKTTACGDPEYMLEKMRARARELYQEGDYAKAKEYYRRMLLLKPADEEAQLCYDELYDLIDKSKD